VLPWELNREAEKPDKFLFVAEWAHIDAVTAIVFVERSPFALENRGA
jgi:hypothetical protein